MRKIKWHDKIWWTLAESLYALAIAAYVGKDEEYFTHFVELHQWCQKHFYDPVYKEWYMILNRDGSVCIPDKGGLQKTAFHLPRAVLKLTRLLEKTDW